MEPIRVLLVDDQSLFRRGLRALLEDEPGIKVIGEAPDGQAGYEAVAALRPDLVLMDLNMPGWGGVEATQHIKADFPETRIVILTVSDEDDQLFSAIAAGAGGYLLKDVKPEELYELIRGAVRGEAPISAAVAGKLLHEFRIRPRIEAIDDAAAQELTPRELEVLQLVTDGLSNGEIAARLFIVEGTVKNHLHNILEKLHLKTRLQAATYALNQGIVSRPRRVTTPPG